MSRSGEQRAHTIVVLAENKDGVLARISSLLTARGYALESLTVGTSQDPTVARLTMVVRGDEALIEKMLKHLRRLIDVLKVTNLTDVDHVDRELLLVRVRAPAADRAEIGRLSEIFRARIVDVSPTAYMLEATGERAKLDALLAALRPFGIDEIARTGKLALARAMTVSRGAPASESKASDHRRYPRYPVEIQARVGSEDDFVTLWARDISGGGLSLLTDAAPFELGSPLRLRLMHPFHQTTLVVEAIVRRHIREPGFDGIAVEFVNLDEGTRRELATFVPSEFTPDAASD
jgi:acetolactate synthase-1/3 small subunit